MKNSYSRKLLILMPFLLAICGCIKLSEGLNEDPYIIFTTKYYVQILKMRNLTSLRKIDVSAPGVNPVMENDHIYVFEKNTTLFYDYQIKNNVLTFHSENLWQGPITNSPTAVNHTIYFGNYAGKVYAIVPDSIAKKKWEFKTGDSVLSSPAVINDIVYVGSNDGILYAIDAITGILKWKFTTGASIKSSPTVVNNTVYFGSNDKKIYALDATTGLKKWEFITGNRVLSSPSYSNSVLFASSSDGNLYKLDGNTGEKISAVACGVTNASPIISQGAVYVCTPGGVNISDQTALSSGNIGNFYLPISNIGSANITAADGKLYLTNGNSLFTLSTKPFQGTILATYTDPNGIVIGSPIVFYLRNNVVVDYSSDSGQKQ